MDHDQASVFLTDLLRLLASRGGSDLFVAADFPPAIKLDGRITAVSAQPLTGAHTAALARAAMNDRQAAEFEREMECNFAISPVGIGRFRVNAYVQQGRVGLVFRTIPTTPPTLDGLRLPERLKEIALAPRGLVIVVGATGCGKSTTLAAMIDHRNEHLPEHIVTIEDPIEFVHPHKKCIVSQREVGVDTKDWGRALKNALRQAPNVILIGEIRDRDTMDHAIAYAETGHLCLATLHASNTNQAFDRILNFFPEDRKAQLLMDLSLNVEAMVSQRLIPLESGRGRVAAVEILLNRGYMEDLILKGDVPAMRAQIAAMREEGMQTFDQHLFDLHEAALIGTRDALRYADSANDLRLRFKLESNRLMNPNLLEGTHGWTVEEAQRLPRALR
jgi:twitching motility protein PilU